MWTVFCFFVAAFAFYALLPFFDGKYRNKKLLSDYSEEQNLLFRKEEILSAINDLEFDFQMKKITEPDYLQLKEKLTQDYVALMKKLDELNKQPRVTTQT